MSCSGETWGSEILIYQLLLVPELLFKEGQRVFFFKLEEEVITGNDFLSYLPTLLHSPEVLVNKKLIWHGLVLL